MTEHGRARPPCIYLSQHIGELDTTTPMIRQTMGLTPQLALGRDAEGRVISARIELAGEAAVLEGDPRHELYRLLCRVARRLGGDRRIVADASWHVWWADDDELAQLRGRYMRFRAIDPDEPGRPLEQVRTARSRLDALGLEVDVSDAMMGWDLLEGTPAELIAQLVIMGAPGVSFNGHGARRIYDQRERLGVQPAPALEEPLDDSLDDAINDWNHELADAGSPYRLISMAATCGALPVGGGERIFFVPADRVAPLVALGIVDFGHEAAAPEASTTLRRFRLERQAHRRAEDLVAPERFLITDGESVDAAEDYEHLVADLCQLAGSELSLERVTCHERQGVRELVVRISGHEATAELEGNTDWVDLPPLLAALNRAAEAAGASRRFYAFQEPDWGQEIGVVCANADEAGRFRGYGLLTLEEELP